MVEQVAETRGQAAERRVHDALRSLPILTIQLDVIAPPELAQRLGRMAK